MQFESAVEGLMFEHVPAVARLMFEHDAVVDAVPPPGLRRVGRPAGRGRGRGRGGRQRRPLMNEERPEADADEAPEAAPPARDEVRLTDGALSAMKRRVLPVLTRFARDGLEGSSYAFPSTLTRPTRQEMHNLIETIAPPVGFHWSHASAGEVPQRILTVRLVRTDAAAPPLPVPAAAVLPLPAAAVPLRARILRRRPAAAFPDADVPGADEAAAPAPIDHPPKRVRVQIIDGRVLHVAE